MAGKKPAPSKPAPSKPSEAWKNEAPSDPYFGSKWQEEKYKAWRKQYPEEPYHAGWDKGYDIKGFEENPNTKAKGGKVKKMAKGGSASSRGDGIAHKGKTKGRFV